MTNTYLKAAGLGLIAGMRSMSAPALVSDRLAREQPPGLRESPLAFLAAPLTANIFKFLAVGELTGDKLPFVPARIAPGPLTSRVGSGALCGAAVCLADGESAGAGAAVGAAAAAASTFAFYHLRRKLGQVTKLPDPAVAVAEDALMVSIGWRIFQK